MPPGKSIRERDPDARVGLREEEEESVEISESAQGKSNTPKDSTPFVQTSVHTHERFGNTLIQAALSGEHDPLSTVIGTEMSLSAAGVGGMETTSNAHMGAMLETLGSGADGESDMLLSREARGSGLIDGDRAAALIHRSRGQKLPEPVAARLSQALGTDISHARIHTDMAAQQAAEAVHAKAFALGQDVFFGEGQFQPGTSQGDELLLHELTHVVQDDEGRIPSTIGGQGVEVSVASDTHEREAESIAREGVAQLHGTGSDTEMSVEESGLSTTSEGTEAATGPAEGMLSRDETDTATPNTEEEAKGQAEDPVEGIRKLLEEDKEDAAIEAMGKLDQEQANEVLNTLRTPAVSAFWDSEMWRATAALAKQGGDLEQCVEWLFEEGFNWDGLKATIEAAPEASRSVLGSAEWMTRLSDTWIAMGNSEIEQLVILLDLPAHEQLQWMIYEGTDYDRIQHRLADQADTPHAQKVLDHLKTYTVDDKDSFHGHLDLWFFFTTLRDTMELIFEARFGVLVGSDGDSGPSNWFIRAETDEHGVQQRTEQQFEAEGLRQLYATFKLMPEAHVKEYLTHVLTGDTNKTNQSSGYAGSGYLEVSYDQNDTSLLESGDFTNPGDRMRGENMMSTTAIHETAHLIDKDGYSDQAAFQALYGWQKHPLGGGGTEILVQTLEADMSTPYDGTLTAKELDIARGLAVTLIDGKTEHLPTTAQIDVVMNAQGLNTAGDPAVAYRSSAQLEAAFQSSDIFFHIQGSSHEDASAWESEPRPYLNSREFHRAYNSQTHWWSYPKPSASNPKMSVYQFRGPGETFAELYALYHITQPKGDKLTASEKAWFEGQSLHGE